MRWADEMRAVVSRRLAVLLAFVFLAGCGSGSPGPQPAELTALEKPRPLRVLWSAQLVEDLRYNADWPPPLVEGGDRWIFFPVLVGDAIYATSRDGIVTRLDAASGRRRWRTAAETPVSSGVGADAETVAVANEDGEVVAFDAAGGKVRWRARVSSEVLAPPEVGGGMVLVRSVDNRIFAFNAADGKRRWVYQRASVNLILHAPAGIALSDDTAYAGFPGGKLVAIALSNGGQRWEATVSVPKGSTELERVSDVVGRPALQGREVCAVAYQGRVGCYESATGRQIWSRELSSATGVSVDARYAYVSDDKGAVQALDRSNGQSVWKQDKLSYRQLTMPLPEGQVVVIGDFEGFVHFLERESGSFVSRYETKGGAVRAVPISLPAGLLVQSEDGTLHALVP
ncbi:MAG TPA: outer membrane protein assembly factor BamB [Burkholderiales bacterium]|nr:outer membrane protein assembly factor BamB [Burkholderiales bacterium]